MSPPLNQLARTRGALHTLLLSTDSGTLSSSDGNPAHTAERVAAALSSMQAASRHASALCPAEGSSWQQTWIQFGDKYLYLFTTGRHPESGLVQVPQRNKIRGEVAGARQPPDAPDSCCTASTLVLRSALASTESAEINPMMGNCSCEFTTRLSSRCVGAGETAQR
ncbi:roadblock/LC7 domain-containing protein [Streptomyces hygroscopicus]|uniref:roadblock/LC7 domain-containing protein n=1 Tax=Streptomyces hygroscopicus TaxID=1912 RepID=UPI001FD52785|nr:roadblock/LC7 domain-containing protein [Streptomyces hygroscopicus]